MVCYVTILDSHENEFPFSFFPVVGALKRQNKKTFEDLLIDQSRLFYIGLRTYNYR